MSRVTTKVERPRRTSINGVRNVLAVSGKEPGYYYRIVNDTGDRIKAFEEMGYELVSSQDIRVGDRRCGIPTQEGSPVQVSVGGGQNGYLMRLKQEWRDEDEKAKAAYVDNTEKGLREEARKSADYGKLTIS